MGRFGNGWYGWGVEDMVGVVDIDGDGGRDGGYGWGGGYGRSFKLEDRFRKGATIIFTNYGTLCIVLKT